MTLAYFTGGGLGPIALARSHDLLGSYGMGFAGCFGILLLALVGQTFAVRRAYGKAAALARSGARGAV